MQRFVASIALFLPFLTSCTVHVYEHAHVHAATSTVVSAQAVARGNGGVRGHHPAGGLANTAHAQGTQHPVASPPAVTHRDTAPEPRLKASDFDKRQDQRQPKLRPNTHGQRPQNVNGRKLGHLRAGGTHPAAAAEHKPRKARQNQRKQAARAAKRAKQDHSKRSKRPD